MAKKLNWFEYWIGHCWMTGWQCIRINFRMWADLMTSNYENYTLMPEDDPYEECNSWFWTSINLDETYPREFLENLMQMVEDVETGKVETYSLEEVMEKLKGEFEDEDPEPN